MNKRRNNILTLAFLIMIVLTLGLGACGKAIDDGPVDESVEYRLVKVESIDGEVNLLRSSEEELEIFSGMQLIPDDNVTTGVGALTELLVDSDKHIGAGENTSFTVNATGTEDNGKVTINLKYGTALFTIDNKLPNGSSFEVNTPNASLSVRGTIFEVTYDVETEETIVKVEEGTVWASNNDDDVILEAGNVGIINYESITVAEEDNGQTIADIPNSNILDIVDLAEAEAGDVVSFGSFGGDKIVWDVLECDVDNVLLISHYVLTEKVYNSDFVDINWGDSDIREWLNEEFYNTSFTADEQTMIQTVTNDNSSTEEFYALYKPNSIFYENRNPGGDTKDKVFLLSWDEVIKYYGIELGDDNSYVYNAVTTYKNGDEGLWWLRSTGHAGDNAMHVHSDGTIYSSFVNRDDVSVRPVICVTR